MRLLNRFGPQVYVAQLGVLAVEGEDLLLGPRLHDQLVRFVVFLAQRGGDFAVAEVGVHRGADREARAQTPTRHHIEHREFLGDANRGIIQRDGIAQHDDIGVAGAAGKRGRHEVGRRHHPVGILMMLVDAEAVVAHLIGEFELVEVIVVKLVADFGVVEVLRNVDPYAAVLVLEILGQVPIRHQMEPGKFHSFSFVIFRRPQPPLRSGIGRGG
jgi:hypothetical protein